MNKHKLVFLLGIGTLLFVGPQRGVAQIKFDKGSWEKVLKKAKKQGKHILVDCYTTWCGPCKLMDRKVFPDKKTGDFYNEHFINVKMDMESPEGREFGQYFFASVYPTFYYLDSQGNTVMKTTGYRSPETFLSDGQQALKETVKKAYGKVDVADERTKEKAKQKNKYLAYINASGYEIEPKEWEQTLADAKTGNKNIMAIIGDPHWPVPDRFKNRDTRTFLQKNFEIVAVAFSQSYLYDENGDYLQDEEGNLVQNDWMKKYNGPVYPGVNFIDADGHVLIGGGMNQALDLAKAVLAGAFKPKVGFFKSIENTGWGFKENERVEEKLLEAKNKNKPLMIMWHRKNDNLLPVYEHREIVDAWKNDFVTMTLNGRARETEAYKKYGTQTAGMNGSISIVDPDGTLIRAYRTGPLTTKETIENVLKNAKTKTTTN